MQIRKSAEDYLKTILILSHRNRLVRSIDIARELDFSKASISIAMKKLREAECIKVGDDGYITLTDKGRSIAEAIYECHTLLTDWLTALGVDRKIAAQDACRIEHVISRESFEAIKNFSTQYLREK